MCWSCYLSSWKYCKIKMRAQLLRFLWIFAIFFSLLIRNGDCQGVPQRAIPLPQNLRAPNFNPGVQPQGNVAQNKPAQIPQNNQGPLQTLQNPPNINLQNPQPLNFQIPQGTQQIANPQNFQNPQIAGPQNFQPPQGPSPQNFQNPQGQTPQNFQPPQGPGSQNFQNPMPQNFQPPQGPGSQNFQNPQIQTPQNFRPPQGPGPQNFQNPGMSPSQNFPSPQPPNAQNFQNPQTFRPPNFQNPQNFQMGQSTNFPNPILADPLIQNGSSFLEPKSQRQLSSILNLGSPLNSPSFSTYQLWYIVSRILSNVPQATPDYILNLQPDFVRGIPSFNLSLALREPLNPQILKIFITQSSGMLLSQKAVIFERIKGQFGDTNLIHLVLGSRSPADLVSLMNPRLMRKNMPAFIKAIGEVTSPRFELSVAKVELLPPNFLSIMLSTLTGLDSNPPSQNQLILPLGGRSSGGSPMDLISYSLMGIKCSQLQLIPDPQLVLFLQTFRNNLYGLRKFNKRKSFPINLRNCGLDALMRVLSKRVGTNGTNALGSLELREIEMIGGEFLSGIPIEALKDVSPEIRRDILFEISSVETFDLIRLLPLPQLALYGQLISQDLTDSQPQSLLRLGNLFCYSDFTQLNSSKEILTQFLGAKLNQGSKTCCFEKGDQARWGTALKNAFGTDPSMWKFEELALMGDLLVGLPDDELDKIRVEELAKGISSILSSSGLHWPIASISGEVRSVPFYKACLSTLSDGSSYRKSVGILMRKFALASEFMVNSLQKVQKVIDGNRLKRETFRENISGQPDHLEGLIPGQSLAHRENSPVFPNQNNQEAMRAPSISSQNSDIKNMRIPVSNMPEIRPQNSNNSPQMIPSQDFSRTQNSNMAPQMRPSQEFSRAPEIRIQNLNLPPQMISNQEFSRAPEIRAQNSNMGPRMSSNQDFSRPQNFMAPQMTPNQEFTRAPEIRIQNQNMPPQMRPNEMREMRPQNIEMPSKNQEFSRNQDFSRPQNFMAPQMTSNQEFTRAPEIRIQNQNMPSQMRPNEMREMRPQNIEMPSKNLEFSRNPDMRLQNLNLAPQTVSAQDFSRGSQTMAPIPKSPQLTQNREFIRSNEPQMSQNPSFSNIPPQIPLSREPQNFSEMPPKIKPTPQNSQNFHPQTTPNFPPQLDQRNNPPMRSQQNPRNLPNFEINEQNDGRKFMNFEREKFPQKQREDFMERRFEKENHHRLFESPRPTNERFFDLRGINNDDFRNNHFTQQPNSGRRFEQMTFEQPRSIPVNNFQNQLDFNAPPQRFSNPQFQKPQNPQFQNPQFQNPHIQNPQFQNPHFQNPLFRPESTFTSNNFPQQFQQPMTSQGGFFQNQPMGGGQFLNPVSIQQQIDPLSQFNLQNDPIPPKVNFPRELENQLNGTVGGGSMAQNSTNSLGADKKGNETEVAQQARALDDNSVPVEQSFSCMGIKAAGPSAVGLSASDIRTLPVEDLLNCIETIGKIEWEEGTKREILGLYKDKLNLTTATISTLNLLELGTLVTAFSYSAPIGDSGSLFSIGDNSMTNDNTNVGTTSTLAPFDISSINYRMPLSLDSLSILGSLPLSIEMRRAIAAKFSTDNDLFSNRAKARPDQLRLALWSLGNLICGLDDSVIRSIFDSDKTLFIEVSPMLGVLEGCSIDTLGLLANYAVQGPSYGPPQSWTSEDLNTIGIVAAGLSPELLGSLSTDAIQGLHPLATKILPIASLQSLSPSHLSAISYEAAYAIQPSHLSSLTPEQITSLHTTLSVAKNSFGSVLVNAQNTQNGQNAQNTPDGASGQNVENVQNAQNGTDDFRTRDLKGEEKGNGTESGESSKKNESGIAKGAAGEYPDEDGVILIIAEPAPESKDNKTEEARSIDSGHDGLNATIPNTNTTTTNSSNSTTSSSTPSPPKEGEHAESETATPSSSVKISQINYGLVSSSIISLLLIRNR